MISQKDVNTIHWGKGSSFQQMSVEKLDIQMERMKLNPYLIPYTKIK